MRMDGRLDEPVWEQVPGYDNMLVMDPDTLADRALRPIAVLLHRRGFSGGICSNRLKR